MNPLDFYTLDQKCWSFLDLIGQQKPVDRLGTRTNDSAGAGQIGEYIESVVASVNFPTSAQLGDATSISLTAGDWDVVLIGDIPAVANVTAIVLGISQTAGNDQTGLVDGSNKIVITPPILANQNSGAIPAYRQSLSATKTIYAKFLANYTGTTPTLNARLSARRMR